MVAAVRRNHRQVWLSVSATTRAPRPGETDGVEYHFVDEAEFARMVAAGELLEHATYAGSSYGTPRAPLEQRLAAGVPALLEVELDGARQVRRSMPQAFLVFLAPPSWAELERRLRRRGTEDAAALERRLATARVELAAQAEFDTVVVNDEVEAAAARLVSCMGI